MLFINSDLIKQAQALEVKILRTAKPCHSQTISLYNILKIYLNEKLNFYHHLLVRNVQMYIRLEYLIN